MQYSPVNMTEKIKVYLTSAICVCRNEYDNQENDKNRKTRNQEDRLAVTIIIRSVDNNKTTVCHLAIPREVSHLLWHEANGRRQRSHQSRWIEDSHA